jgi:uracil-DNA glycosylase
MEHELNSRVQRAVRQQLESLKRAGLTHLPRIASPGASVAAAADAGSGTPQSASPASSADRSRTTVDETRAAPIAAATEAPPATAAQSESPLSLSDRQQELAVVAERVAACMKCRELAETRTQTVFGVGNPQAELLFIGEAPGADEDRQGEPFVGKAGQLLNKIIEAARLTREEIYICNILRCRPPGNRNPTPEEAGNCREYLEAQIRIVDPDYIVCWGTIAAQNLLDTTLTIGRLRRKFHTYGRAKVLCTYHPSYLLRTPSAKKDVWEDIKFLRRAMGVELDAK